MTQIHIDAGKHRYIYEFMKTLPDNCRINKVICGSGLTSVVLYNEELYVLCVPFKNLVKNKHEWCKEQNIKSLAIFSRTNEEKQVYGENIKVDDIRNFIKNEGKKLIVTWDSIVLIVEALGSDISKWKILIDEEHKLIDSASFRGKAIRKIFGCYKKFKSYCFGTATPIREKYVYDELKVIPQYIIDWSDDVKQEVNINLTKMDKDLLKSVTNICIKHHKNELIGNAHIFINSVKDIAKILRLLKKMKINYNDYRVVASNNDYNNKLLEDNLGKKIIISEINSPVKVINFYTATAFEGCDIYDKDGITYVVSDGSKDHSKIDILTTLPQIAGRIRDSHYINNIHLIYSPNSRYYNITEAEFEADVKAKIKDYKDLLSVSNADNKVLKKLLINDSNTEKYIIYEDGILELNEMVLNDEMNSFDTIHTTYYVNKNNIDDANETYTHKNNDIDYNYKVVELSEMDNALYKVRLGSTSNFKKLCLLYNNEKILPSQKEDIIKKEPLIKEAFEKLGFDKMRALMFLQKSIKKELLKLDKLISNKEKIHKLLNLYVGQWLSMPEINLKLDLVYKELGIVKTPKSKDLLNYGYEFKDKQKTVNFIKTRGIIITNINFK